MKRALLAAFCVIALCSVCLLVNTATVKAAYAGYSHMVYYLQTAVTVDGKWTSNTEWVDSLTTSIGTNAVFKDKWFLASFEPILVNQHILIEILNDNTNDTGDYWQICFDGNMDGGTAPKSDDLRLDIVGHTNVTWYKGTGTGWAPMATPPATQFQWADSISASPYSSAPHWICEIIIDKPDVGIGPQFWARYAVYDASNSAAGVQAWPPTSRDVPDNWGDFPYTMDAFPESLSFGVVVLLSSVSALVGLYYFRKRSKIESCGSGKP